MNLKMGSQIFQDVQIPMLWGSRAVLQDKQGRLSLVDLSGKTAKLEIVGDKPAPGIEFVPVIEGFKIFDNGNPLYIYYPKEKRLSSINLELPECQIGQWEIRVGTNVFSSNVVAGFGVGIAVTKDGIAMGAPLPPNLAKLVI